MPETPELPGAPPPPPHTLVKVKRGLHVTRKSGGDAFFYFFSPPKKNVFAHYATGETKGIPILTRYSPPPPVMKKKLVPLLTRLWGMLTCIKGVNPKPYL